MRGGVRLTYCLYHYGWIRVTVVAGEGHFTFRASYLEDSPRDIIQCLIALFSGAPRAVVIWVEEPGSHRWELVRSDESNIRVQIHHNNDRLTDNDRDDPAWVSVGVVECGTRDLAVAVVHATHELIDRDGPEYYAKQWGWKPPTAGLTALERLLEG